MVSFELRTKVKILKLFKIHLCLLFSFLTPTLPQDVELETLI